MSILVFIEQRDGRIRPVANEVLGEASRLKADLGGEVVAVVPCASDPGAAALGAAGADRILVATHESFGLYDAAGYTAAIAAAASRVKPAAVLFPASAMGKDLAPRVAARLGVGIATDCTALAVESGSLVATRPVFAGKALQRISFPNSPAVVSLRPKVFAASAAAGAGVVEALAVTIDANAPRARVTRVAAAAGGKVDLDGVRGHRVGRARAEGSRALRPDRGAGGSARRARSARRAPSSTRAGGRTPSRSARPARPCRRSSTSRSGSPARSSTSPACRRRAASSRSTRIPRRRSSRSRTTGSSATLFEVLPALTEAVKKLNAAHA